jgi:hypothetical protein
MAALRRELRAAQASVERYRARLDGKNDRRRDARAKGKGVTEAA